MTDQVAIIGLDIPEKSYQTLCLISTAWKSCSDKNGITIVYGFWADNLTGWLLDQTQNHGSAFEIIGPVGRKIKLGLSDDLNAIHWTDKIIQELSEQAGLSQLWDKWNNDL